MKLIFLGSGGTMPTAERALPSIALKRDGELLLFDCAEGTQRQMLRAGISPVRPKAIFITHFHGDHFLGLAGLAQTMSLMDRTEPLEIYGPPGTEEKIEKFLGLPYYTLTFEVQIQDLEPGAELKRRGYRILTAPIEHTVPGIAYALVEDQRPGKFNVKKARELGIKPGPNFSKLQAGQSIELPSGRVVKPEEVMGPPRPGRKLVYANDTRPCDEVVKLAHDADVLLYDCTLNDELADKAIEGGHSTPTEAAQVAKEANVRQLILIHISPRYTDPTMLVEQAKRIFPNTIAAHDLMELEIKLRE
jgi:ribonuclease Z